MYASQSRSPISKIARHSLVRSCRIAYWCSLCPCGFLKLNSPLYKLPYFFQRDHHVYCESLIAHQCRSRTPYRVQTIKFRRSSTLLSIPFYPTPTGNFLSEPIPIFSVNSARCTQCIRPIRPEGIARFFSSSFKKMFHRFISKEISIKLYCQKKLFEINFDSYHSQERL